MFDYLEQVWRL